MHSCAIDLAQNGWCWGYNGEGELGIDAFGPGAKSALATVVHTTASLKSIALGGLHTCATTTTGQVLCWGYDGHGQLGDGTTTNTGTPTAVSGGLTFLTDPTVIFPSPDPDFPCRPDPSWPPAKNTRVASQRAALAAGA